MALVLIHDGEQKMLEAIVNKTAPASLVCNLFSNNITCAKTDTNATYTDVTGGGYGTKALTPADWTWTSATPSHIDLPQADTIWTFTGVIGGSGIVYGYFVTQTDANGVCIWSENISPTFQPANNGDQLKLTLVLTLT